MTGPHAEERPALNSVQHPSRLAGLDVLRAVAALMIVAFHAAVQAEWQPIESAWPIGQMGRRLFIVLSAFLLFMPYARAVYGSDTARRRVDLAAYALKRALRLLPLYVAAVLVLTVLGYIRHSPANAKNLLYHLLFIHTFDESTYFGLMGPLWFIAVIAHWYILLPFVGWIWLKLKHPLEVWAIVTLVMAVAYALVWPRGPLSRTALTTLIDRSLLGALPSLFAAMTAAAYFVRTRRQGNPSARPWPIALVLPIAFVAIAALVLFADRGGHHASPLALPAIALALAFASPGGKLLRPICSLGKMSYSVYVCHSPVLVLVAMLPALEGIEQDLLRTALIFAVALPPLVLASYVSYRLFEAPFLKLKVPSPRRTLVRVAAAYAGLVLASAVLYAASTLASKGETQPTAVPRNETTAVVENSAQPLHP